MIIRDNTEGLASIPPESGARVIRGPVRYPGHHGSLDVGDVDIEELLCELKDQEVLLIIAPLRPVQRLATICGLCGTPYRGGQCPVCQAEREQAKRSAEESLLFDEGFSGLLGED